MYLTALGLSCDMWGVFFVVVVAACGIWLPDQGLNSGPLLWELGVLTTGPPGNSLLLNSVIKKQVTQKLAKHRMDIFQRACTHSQLAYEKILNIISHQGNADQNLRYLLMPTRTTYKKRKQVLVRLWRNLNHPHLLTLFVVSVFKYICKRLVCILTWMFIGTLFIIAKKWEVSIQKYINWRDKVWHRCM